LIYLGAVGWMRFLWPADYQKGSFGQVRQVSDIAIEYQMAKWDELKRLPGFNQSPLEIMLTSPTRPPTAEFV
jgi:hypothetical protein